MAGILGEVPTYLALDSRTRDCVFDNSRSWCIWPCVFVDYSDSGSGAFGVVYLYIMVCLRPSIPARIESVKQHHVLYINSVYIQYLSDGA